jgi:hypothetical protein
VAASQVLGFAYSNRLTDFEIQEKEKIGQSSQTQAASQVEEPLE